jgi:hypothetical protein
MRRVEGLMLGLWLAVAVLAGCQTTFNETGSMPLNEQEEIDFKKALLRCYKTGGTRIVKIAGDLKCY